MFHCQSSCDSGVPRALWGNGLLPSGSYQASLFYKLARALMQGCSGHLEVGDAVSGAQRVARLPLRCIGRGCSLSRSGSRGLCTRDFPVQQRDGSHVSSPPCSPHGLTFLSGNFEDLRALAWVKMPEVGTVFLCKGGRRPMS